MELEKMSDEELKQEYVNSYLNRFKSYEHQERHDLVEKIFLKRLKTPEIWSYTNITPEQAVEEFKKKLIEEINKLASSEKGFIHKQETINLINNIDKKLDWSGWKDPKQEAEKAVIIHKNNIK